MKKIIALVLVVVFAIFGGIFAVTHIKVIDAGKVGGCLFCKWRR